jgi:hypothetical protein
MEFGFVSLVHSLQDKGLAITMLAVSHMWRLGHMRPDTLFYSALTLILL